ncbi:MAG TPA: HlyD family secretion protein [Methylomirabilota bacterium]|nr:HlyD family secretion protein [Methylomirabilota bacterium]
MGGSPFRFPSRPGLSRRLLTGLAVLVALAAIGYGVHAWFYSLAHVSTDDAYVEGTVATLSAKVVGYVVDLLVDENRPVKRGELVLRIDRRDYEAKRDQARAAAAVAAASFQSARSDADLARETTRAQADEARASLESARVAEQSAHAGVDEARATVEAKRAAVAAMRADVAGARSSSTQAVREKDRMRRLVQDGYVSQREFDQADSSAETSGAAFDAVQRRLTQAEREVQQTEAQLAGRVLAVAQARQRIAEARATLARVESQRHQVTLKEAEVGRAQARVTETQADLAYAELQLQHTEVLAPIDGMVAKKSVELGQMVQVGQPLMAIVPLHDVWVVANFKETQLARVKPGMPAVVHIDTFSGQSFHGAVDSISAGTGARFSLLPPENATGNWVKVVQRVPVKIRLDPREFGNPHTLRAGMSAVVTIKVK